jgi:hypothetical protein
MAYFPRTVSLKTEESCDGDGDICANKEIDSNDSGSDAAQSTEQVCIYIYIYVYISIYF